MIWHETAASFYSGRQYKEVYGRKSRQCCVKIGYKKVCKSVCNEGKPMKNILIISSSPRKNGNSQILCKQFKKGAEAKGHQVKIVRIMEKNTGLQERYMQQTWWMPDWSRIKVFSKKPTIWDILFKVRGCVDLLSGTGVNLYRWYYENYLH